MPLKPRGKPFGKGHDLGANHRFVKGVSGNPGGRIQYRREKLANHFYADLLRDWRKHGTDAIVSMRENDPAKYVSVVASVVPKELLISGEVTHYHELSDAELDARITEAIASGLAAAAAVAAEGGESGSAGVAGGTPETLQ